MKKTGFHITVLIVLMVMILPSISSGNQAMQTIPPDTVTVNVLGTNADSRFEPQVVRVRPGDVIQFEVKEGIHTVTAYHPDNRRDLRIPTGAQSFDSGPLTDGDTWFLTITHTGEYNYFCMPHERMGHVGKILSNSSISNNTSTIYNN